MGTQPSLLLHPSEVIEGISPLHATALAEAGITTLASLIGAGCGKLRRVTTTASASEIDRWLFIAGQLRVKEITPRLADIFVQAGLCQLSQLAEAGLQQLEKIVQMAASEGHLTKIPTVYQLAEIQQSAWKLRDQGMLAGRVLEHTGLPSANAQVEVGRHETEINDAGWFAFDAVPAGDAKIRITLTDRQLPLEMPPQKIVAERLTGPLTLRVSPPSGKRLPVIREIDGHPIANTSGTRMKMAWRALSETPEGDLLQVEEIVKDGGSRLFSYYKERIGPIIYVYQIKASASELPTGTVIGDILVYTNGHLHKSSLTLANIVVRKRQKAKKTRKAAQPPKRHIVQFPPNK